MSARPATLRFPIPTVLCPRCGSRMRLTTILPDAQDRDRMTFSCGCGFDFQQSATAAPESTL